MKSVIRSSTNTFICRLCTTLQMLKHIYNDNRFWPFNKRPSSGLYIYRLRSSEGQDLVLLQFVLRATIYFAT